MTHNNSSPATELLPCPFCGGIAEISTRLDEDLWSHNTVEWTTVSCDECDVSFSWPPGAVPDAITQWNTRASQPATLREVVQAQAEVELAKIQPTTPTGGEAYPVAWIVLSEETHNTRIWWRDEERAKAWSAKTGLPLIPLYARPQPAQCSAGSASAATPKERGNRFCAHDDCPYPDCLVDGGVCPSQPPATQRAADYLFTETTKLDAPISYTACLALAKHILGAAQPSREAVIEECAKIAEGSAPIAAGNFFAARRDQCAKIAAKIRGLSLPSTHGDTP